MLHDEVDVAICSALEAVTKLGDAAFETQIGTTYSAGKETQIAYNC